MKNKLLITLCLAASLASGAYAADISKTDGKTSDTSKTSISAATPATKGAMANTKPATGSTAVKAAAMNKTPAGTTTMAKTTNVAEDTKTKSAKDSSTKN